MLKGFKDLTKSTRWALGIGLAVVLAAIIAAVLLWNAWQSAATAKTATKLATNQGEAAIESGAKAAETIGDVGARAAASDRIGRENEHEIRSAPGADAPVDDGVGDALLASLCRRAAYRSHPDCVQPPAAEGMAQRSSRR